MADSNESGKLKSWKIEKLGELCPIPQLIRDGVIARTRPWEEPLRRTAKFLRLRPNMAGLDKTRLGHTGTYLVLSQ